MFLDFLKGVKLNTHTLANHIHGIPIGGGGLPENSLKDIVLEFYKKNKVDEKSAIAYKGGTIEEKLLTKLNIPHTNLEDYGCPKASELFKQKTVSVESCGKHTLIENKHEHCPKCEVQVFLSWFKSNIV